MRPRRIAVGATAVAGLAVLALLALSAGLADQALAQSAPFGVPRLQAAPPVAADGLAGWLIAKQAEFYRALAGTLRGAKADDRALWSLMGLSFAYGVFHAAGPGHGKAVISSYIVANEETWRRGVVLSFASALLQALVAVAIVAVAALAFKATARAMTDAVRWIEIASYALIALIGLRLLWSKGRLFLAALGIPVGASVSGAGGGGMAPAADCGDDCGHVHAPLPEQLAGPGGWRRGLSAIVAVGLRPCSGAILVLVFSLAQGLFWAGIASTFLMGLGTAITVAAIATLAVGAKGLAVRLAGARTGWGTIALRGIEVAAALAVTAFGTLLLAGYMASERMIGV